jgi:hypothetical protein
MRHADIFENDVFDADLCDILFRTCVLTWQPHLYTRICIRVYVYICTRIYVYAYIRIIADVCADMAAAPIYAHMYTRICIYMYAYICVFVLFQTCALTWQQHLYVRKCTYLYAYIYARIISDACADMAAIGIYMYTYILNKYTSVRACSHMRVLFPTRG